MRNPTKPAKNDRTQYDSENRFAGAVLDFVDHKTGELELTKTKLEMQDECDINVLMETYQKTGQINHTSLLPPRYGDFSNTVDYQTALNAVHEANDAFADLPANIRNYFDNDPALLIDFMNDPNNQAEAEELGLVEKPTAPETVTVAVEEPPITEAEKPTDT